MKIISDIIRTLCLGTVSSLACQAAIQAYADAAPTSFTEGQFSPEVAHYVQSIAGVALASGLRDYNKEDAHSYQVLAQVLNNGNMTVLPHDLKRAIDELISYVPDPYEIIQPYESPQQVDRMKRFAERILFLTEEKYGVNPEVCMELMLNALKPHLPDILRSCDMEGESLPVSTEFRPRLGKALQDAYDKLTEPPPATPMRLR